MKKYLDEFKDFINKGDVITIAVGLVMALYFQKIVDAVLDGRDQPDHRGDLRRVGLHRNIGVRRSATPRISIGLVHRRRHQLRRRRVLPVPRRQGVQPDAGAEPAGRRPATHRRSPCSPRSATSCAPGAAPGPASDRVAHAASRFNVRMRRRAASSARRAARARAGGVRLGRGGVTASRPSTVGDVGAPARPSSPPTEPTTRAGRAGRPTRRAAARRPTTSRRVARRPRPVERRRSASEPVGRLVDGNRVLVIGDSILASISDRYGGPALRPRSCRAGGRSRSTPRSASTSSSAARCSTSGCDDGWDAAVVMLGNNYDGDPRRSPPSSAPLLDELAPLPVVLRQRHRVRAGARPRSTT